MGGSSELLNVIYRDVVSVVNVVVIVTLPLTVLHIQL
ncbi:hypothetical protein MPER_02357 [Moniliophthora perniciosa FA553]|nr:hypothetical protein MPER_02357 [Moniliophthora perniciosa FA553]